MANTMNLWMGLSIVRQIVAGGTGWARGERKLGDRPIQQANVPWPTGWFNLRLEIRGNSFEGYVNDTLRVSGVTRYSSGEADPVVPPDTGEEDWYTVYTGKFLGWGVVPGATGQQEMADDYALCIYR